jgi:hypothetical protein
VFVVGTACSGGPPTRTLAGRLVCADCGPLVDGEISVDFGLVSVGRTVDRTLRLHDGGAGPLRVELLPVPAPFSVEGPAHANLEPGAEITIRVSFAPTGDGPAHQILDLGVSSGQAQRIRLTGTGAKPRMECGPASLDFGLAVLGSRVTRTVQCRNLRQDIDIELFATTSAPFRAAAPATIAAGAGAEVAVDYVPGDAGPATGTLHLGGVGVDPQAVELQGRSIPTGLVVRPDVLDGADCYDLGNVPPGSEARLALTLENQGNAGIWLQTFVVDPGPFRIEQGFPVPLPAVGGALSPVQVDVIYAPTVVSPTTGGELAYATLAYNEVQPSTRSFCFRGRSSGPVVDCMPRTLDFGELRLGSQGKLEVECTNVGSLGPDHQDLEVSTVETAAPFHATLGSTSPTPPDESFTVSVAYDAGTAGEFTDTVLIDTNAGQVHIPVHASTRATSCLLFDAPTLDFGVVGPGCRSPSLTVDVINVCNQPVIVEQMELTPGGGSFSVTGAPEPGFVLLGGGVLELQVGYAPTVSGPESATLTLLGVGDPAAAQVAISGEAQDVITTTDVIDGALPARSDLLVVLDNSGSMTEELPSVRTNLGALLDTLIARSVDFHLALTTTGTTSTSHTGSCPGGAGGLENGRFFPVDGSSARLLTSRMSPEFLRASWKKTIDVGTCRDEERGLTAATRALTSPLIDSADAPDTEQPDDGNAGFLRSGAGLSVIFVTDDDDKSPLPVASYLNLLRTVKGTTRSDDLLRVHAIDGGVNRACEGAAAPGTRYQELVSATSGLRQDICDADWGDIVQAIVEGIRQAPRCHLLRSRPGPPQGGSPTPSESWFQVRIDGIPLPPGSGATRAWYYDPAARSLCFEGLFAPGNDDHVEIEYAVSCR